MAEDESGGEQPIIIKKIKKGGGHHGGAWKVAYADFVTAMMAFFLLLWLLNVTTEEQKNAISNFFDPTHPKVSEAQSGAGGVMGGTSMSVDGAMVSTAESIAQPPPGSTQTNAMNAAKATNTGKGESLTPSQAQSSAVEQAKEELRQAEEEALKEVQDAIEQAIQENPDLQNLAENLIVDMTPEGLRIQVVDAEGNSMFASGSARMYQKTEKLMTQVAEIIKGVPNEVSIRGHTDSIPYGAGADYTNWDLSTDRANSSRRVMEQGGLPAERINNVVGKADTEHLLPDEPQSARNRRISIVLLREELTDPEAYEKRANELAKKKREENPPPTPTIGSIPLEGEPRPPILREDGTPSLPTPQSGDYERTEGDVQFP